MLFFITLETKRQVPDPPEGRGTLQVPEGAGREIGPAGEKPIVVGTSNLLMIRVLAVPRRRPAPARAGLARSKLHPLSRSPRG